MASTRPPIVAGVASRTFVRSSTVTRSSSRMRGCSWPWPTSRATTWAAPRVSRQSVKPPVEAPTSSTRRPVTSMSKCVRAASSFSPPRPTNRGGGPVTTSASPAATSRAGLSATAPLTSTRCSATASAGLGAAGDETPSHELGIEAPAGAHSAACAWWRPCARRTSRPPSSPWPSWPPTSWPARPTSWPVAFLAVAFLAGGLLGGRLLRRAPSWPGPSWPRPSWRSPSSPRPSWPAPSWRSTWWPRPARPPGWGRNGTRSPRAGPRRRRRGWPATRAAWPPRPARSRRGASPSPCPARAASARSPRPPSGGPRRP